MKAFLTALLVATLTGLLFGCASSGPKIDTSQLDALRVGQTTAAQVYKQFGLPSFKSTNMDGTQTAIYVHSDSKSGASVVPIFDSITGGTESNTETVTFRFDEKGLLADYKVVQAGGAKPAPEAAPTAAATTATAAKSSSDNATATKAAPDSATKSTAPAVAGAATTAAAKPAPGAAAQPAKSSIQLNLPSFLPSATKDPRNPY